jgi:hypothetical protein
VYIRFTIKESHLDKMKKLLLLPFMILFFSACSTDDSVLEETNDAIVFNDAATAHSAGRMAPEAAASVGVDTSCFPAGTSGSVNITGAFSSPAIEFIASIPFVPASNVYRIKLEVQELSDCEDMSSNSSFTLTFNAPTTFTNVSANSPKITVLPAQLPTCYRWRIFTERVYTGTKIVSCTSTTRWYDAPVF